MKIEIRLTVDLTDKKGRLIASLRKGEAEPARIPFSVALRHIREKRMAYTGHHVSFAENRLRIKQRVFTQTYVQTTLFDETPQPKGNGAFSR